MIEVNRLNGKSFLINCDLIKTIESTPDTLITLTTNEKVMVQNSIEDILNKTMNYRKRLYQEAPVLLSQKSKEK
jgi:flagellar protein FlbD